MYWTVRLASITKYLSHKRIEILKMLRMQADSSGGVCSYTFSRQRRDERIERRGEQRSAVLISAFPYTSVLLQLASVLGPSLLMSFTALAAHLLSDSLTVWSPPRPGKLVRLNVGPQHLSGFIPLDEYLPDPVLPATATIDPLLSSSLRRSGSSLQSQSSWSGAIPAVGGSADVGGSDSGSCAAPQAGLFCDFDLEIFYDQIHSLWALWEVLMTGRPLLVYAKSPKECTSAVAALISLIMPLPYQADFRPLLSIHDPQIQDVLVRPSRSLCCVGQPFLCLVQAQALASTYEAYSTTNISITCARSSSLLLLTGALLCPPNC
jgi:hypothetical protein